MKFHRLLGHARQRADEDGSVRYSRLAGDLGADILHRLQHSCFAVVGAGNACDSLADTPVRYGAFVRLCLLERARSCAPFHADVAEDGVQVHGVGNDEGLRALLRLRRPCADVSQCRLPSDVVAARRCLARAHVVVSVDKDAAWLGSVAESARVLRLPHLHLEMSGGPQAPDAGNACLALPGSACLICSRSSSVGDANPLQDGQAASGTRQFLQEGIGVSAADAPVHIGVRFIETFCEGKLTSSRQVRLEWSAADSLLRVTERRCAPLPACPVCVAPATAG